MNIIVCPKCLKKHSVDVAKLPEVDIVQAKWKACKQRFPVRLDIFRKPEKSVIKAIPEKKHARKICVSLSKGGVGKTTTSVNLSAGLALAGFKVLLVDTDTQGQSSYMLGKKPHAGLTELLTGELSLDEVVVEARKNLWVLSGGRSLAGVKRLIDKKSFGAEWTLSEAMADCDERFDFIIMDTSPGWDQLTVNVLFYANEILVPVALEVMPLHGLAEFTKSLSSIQKYRKDIEVKYVLPTFMDDRVEQPKHIHAKLASLYEGQICKPIRYNEKFSSAPSYGKTIFEYAPDSSGAEDYSCLVRKVANDSMLLREFSAPAVGSWAGTAIRQETPVA